MRIKCNKKLCLRNAEYFIDDEKYCFVHYLLLGADKEMRMMKKLKKQEEEL